MKRYAYVRVSSQEQNEERQLIAMRQLNISEKNIYVDKQSGKDFNRPMYRKLVRKRVKWGGVKQNRIGIFSARNLTFLNSLYIVQ